MTKRQITSIHIANMTIDQVAFHYVMGKYCYYKLNESTLTFQAYRRAGERLKCRFDSIEHPFKQYLNKEKVLAGTDDGRLETYPKEVTDSIAWEYVEAVYGGLIEGLKYD